MNRFFLLSVLFSIVSASSTTANAAFLGRLETSPGSGVFQAYYNGQLDITLLTDTSFASTNNFGVAGINPTTGIMTWDTANLWIAAMNDDGGAGYLGINSWRLPSVDVNGDDVLVNCTGNNTAACLDNEMGYLYWEEGIFSNGVTPGTSDPFINVNTPYQYWSNNTYVINTAQAWIFNFNNGGQSPLLKDFGSNPAYAWAVVDGDVGAVPVPAAVWLFGSGLLALVGVARRKIS